VKSAIMQPYIFPYIGYFQLMNAVDEFVVYDNIELSKKGWINRNRVLVNGKDEYITLTLKKNSDFLHIKDRFLADTWEADRKKIINRITESYRKAPHFVAAFEVIERCILYHDKNLFNFILYSLNCIKEYLNITTKLVTSSTIEINHSLKSEEKVIAICKVQSATTYINPIGGVNLYNKNNFSKEGIELQFLQAKNVEYEQYKNEFVPWLSIIDVMMFNSKEEIQNFLNNNYILN
jgi:hypothetical protein